MGSYYRLYKNKEDYIKLYQFIEESVSVSGPCFYFGLGDFDFCVMEESSLNYLENIDDIFKDLHIWFNEEDEIIGALWPDENVMDMFLHPNKTMIFDDMARVGEEYCRENNYKEIEWSAFEGNSELEEVLISRGYNKAEMYRTHYLFDYSSEVGEGKLPEGYKIKELLDVEDKSVITQCCKKYFNLDIHEEMLKNFIKTGTYRRNLDLVIMSPDNVVACFCTVRYDEKNRIASFEPVGCNEDFKRMGLTKAIMFEGLNRVRDLGAEVVTVQTSSPMKNPAANKLYESVGFKLTKKVRFWRKNLL